MVLGPLACERALLLHRLADRTTASSRALVACALLIWLAATTWSAQIDDVYISASFARSLVETGELRWPGGAVVEGFSNLSWVLGLALFEAMGGDVPWLAQLAALACGCGVLAIASEWLPTDRRGSLILVGIALWSPLSYWSSMGMETTLYTLLLVVGWPAICAGRSWGLVFLMAAALTRPEGTAMAVLGCAVLGGRGARWTLTALAGFHVWRLWLFGSPLSTVAQVKLGSGSHVLGQLPLELLLAVPLLWLAWGSGAREDDRYVALAPLGVSVAALVAIGGDWMAMGRLLLPGVVASTVALARVHTARGSVSWVWLLGLAVVGSIQPRFLVWPTFRVPTAAPWCHYAEGLEPVLAADQRWIIENLPDGAVVQSQDVGVLSHIPGITVVDSDGLVDPRFAWARGSGGWAWVSDWYDADERPTAIRTAAWHPTWRETARPEGLDPWLYLAEDAWSQHYRPAASLEHEVDAWRAWIRYDRHEASKPSPERVAERWAELAERFPSQPFYRAGPSGDVK